ncbi:hypothetical protein [Spiroplasma sp. DGKH1]|uniref:hypothetical protein n=1 Tax=Spiroplasma sp. DGKH1 TaxID=3050074 RepID=UPI0034C6484B
MKLNGLGLGGIIIILVGSGLCILGSIIILFAGLSTFNIAGQIILFFVIMSLILLTLAIIFGALAITKNNNGLRITCAVLAIVAIAFAWINWGVPVLLLLVGGILTLCGRMVPISAPLAPNPANNYPPAASSEGNDLDSN